MNCPSCSHENRGTAKFCEECATPLRQEGEGRAKAAYGVNYDRLVALKNKYDPMNFFHLNQNIKPSV